MRRSRQSAVGSRQEPSPLSCRLPTANCRLFLVVLLLALACNRQETASAPPPPTANPERGRQLAAQYGCNACHTIPGVEGPHGALAPSLQGLASRPTISMGTVQNTPGNLTKFIMNPASLNPQSSMPPVGLTPEDAKDIAAYLGTLG